MWRWRDVTRWLGWELSKCSWKVLGSQGTGNESLICVKRSIGCVGCDDVWGKGFILGVHFEVLSVEN